MIWHIYGVRGLRDKVKESIQGWNAKIKADPETSNVQIPDDVATFICQEIDRLPPECVIVKVDAYGQTHAGGSADHLMRNSQITVVGIRG